jgi:alginate O-acetyltransferase complex protein AlgI
MLFHTWIFFIFFLIVYPVYRWARGTRFEFPWLLVASYVFYGWWNPLYLIIIVYSTAFDYWVVVMMDKSSHKKFWIALSIISNMGLLGFFKYAGFVTENLNALLRWGGGGYAIPAPGVALPVGISFFTFQSMSYIVDCYRGVIERERSFIRYATYVSLFTQLVAGPVERAGNLLRQLRASHPITRADISDGLSLFVVGLFKKVAIADYLSLYVDKVYSNPGHYQAPALLLATFAFAWQIYCDFAGYTDMARGIARMMGLRLMLNFNNPYLADGLGDFWNRWHISLSTWFKDYVYVPLGGNRNGTFNTYRNMFLTMVLSGIWHGASWNFLIWGLLHAFGRVGTRELERSASYRDRVPRFVKQMGVFAFVSFAWIFFRARHLSDAWLIVSRIFTTGWADPEFPILALVLVFGMWIYQFVYESRLKGLVESAPVRVAIIVFLLCFMAMFFGRGDQAFIYFQF